MRRLLFRVLLILGLTAVSFPLLENAAYTIEVPKTLHAKVAVGRSNRADLPFRTTHIGLSWKGSEDDAPWIRTSQDGVVWSGWTQPPIAHDMDDEALGIHYTGLIGGGDARHVEVSDDEGVEAPVIAAINTRDGPKRKVKVERKAEGATPQPHVISRAEWGADESLRSGTPSFARVNRLFVHHTASGNSDPDPAGTIRAIYSYHTQGRGWNDIGYNFLIDAWGNVYEGRWARSYRTGELPNGENLNGSGVVGAHVSGFNTGSAGVALLGEFTGSGPSSQATDALVSFLAWKADRHGISPHGTLSGIPNIAGHRDAGSTACPGSLLYNNLPSVRDSVESRIQALSSLSPPAMPTGTELFPPGVSRDLMPIASGAVSRSATLVRLTFEGSTPLRVRSFDLTPSSGSFSLARSHYGGVPLWEDTYKVTAVAFDAGGRPSPDALVSGRYLVTTGEIPIGYWVLGTDGGIFTFGSANFYGSTGAMRLNKPIVGMAATPSGNGYWLVASDGGIFTFGSANYFGSTGAIRLNKPIVGMAATPSGNGYWLVATDGGIFTFGDARFFGSTGAIRLNQPIVGMTSTPSGNGYWLVASDGGIFTFGDARFFGSTGAIRLNQPVIGMASSPSGGGYWLVAADGGIFTFGDATYLGSLPGRGVGATAAGMQRTNSGKGYYIVTTGGGMYTFGEAPFYGSPSSSGLRITGLGTSLVH